MSFFVEVIVAAVVLAAAGSFVVRRRSDAAIKKATEVASTARTALNFQVIAIELVWKKWQPDNLTLGYAHGLATAAAGEVSPGHGMQPIVLSFVFGGLVGDGRDVSKLMARIGPLTRASDGDFLRGQQLARNDWPSICSGVWPKTLVKLQTGA